MKTTQAVIRVTLDERDGGARVEDSRDGGQALPGANSTSKNTISNAFLWVLILSLSFGQSALWVDKQCERWPVEIWGCLRGWSAVAVLYGFLVAACVKGREPIKAMMTGFAMFLGLKMAAFASERLWYKVSSSGTTTGSD